MSNQIKALLPTFTKVIRSFRAYEYLTDLDYVFMITNAPSCGRRNRHHVIRLNTDTGRAKCIGNELTMKHCLSIVDREIKIIKATRKKVME
jgi:hypothetical protein